MIFPLYALLCTMVQITQCFMYKVSLRVCERELWKGGMKCGVDGFKKKGARVIKGLGLCCLDIYYYYNYFCGIYKPLHPPRCRRKKASAYPFHVALLAGSWSWPVSLGAFSSRWWTPGGGLMNYTCSPMLSWLLHALNTSHR